MKTSNMTTEVKIGFGILLVFLAFAGIRGIKKRNLEKLQAAERMAAETQITTPVSSTTLPPQKPTVARLSAAQSLALAKKNFAKMKAESEATVRYNMNKQYTEQEVQARIRSIASQSNLSNEEKSSALTDFHNELAISKTKEEKKNQFLQKVDMAAVSLMSPRGPMPPPHPMKRPISVPPKSK